MGSEIMGYKHAMFGLCSYGPYWRETRKIATVELLSNQRIEMLKHIREFEVKSGIKVIYNNWAKNNLNGVVKMEMKEWFGDIVMNTMGKIWLDIGGHEKAMKKVSREMDSAVEEWLADHKTKREIIKSGKAEDFMDVMLSICENRGLPEFDADTAIKATCMIRFDVCQ
ncbi:hypothetical protein H5410_024492 [Solanum commersonii]|uniref:Cytochrome P450 n=1 Tax=Solanum commersonii TaxID=4109 RepID=A0A9J5ZM45_SOLCO|nr:hypothetical protein H5410_024492 [Solanum commersonii]